VNPLQEIKQLISESVSPEEMHTRIVAIDGCGGAGKSTLALKLANIFGDCPVIHTDDFASWDHPLDWYPRIIGQVLEPLRHNQVAHFQKFDWQAKQLGQWETVNPCSVVILEGVSSSRSEFRPYLSFSIYIETDRDLRLKRGLERDGEAALPLWQQWMAEEDEYLLRDQPQEYTDVVISGNTEALLRISS
tara:strand:+ start:332 stop:901 length:570 start_codon:yes stop_codon:yes gene_type:complete